MRREFCKAHGLSGRNGVKRQRDSCPFDRLAYLSRGSIFGEQQALADEPAEPSAATAFADSHCVVGYIEPTALMAAVQARPELLRVLLRVTRQKKLLLLDELERAAFQSARSQIAAVLSALTHERPVDEPPGAIRMSQDRLARLSGRTRVTVAAQLHALADAGAIRLERSRIVVLDPRLLASIADED